MKANPKTLVVISITLVCLVLSNVPLASAEEYEAMKGVNNANVIFDMRDGIPKIAAVHLKLIYETYRQLAAMSKHPVVVVVFIGSAVRLISSNRAEFDTEERQYLSEIAETISRMSKDGIELEVCLAAVNYFGIDPASIQSEFRQVPNGWISEIGYQARGYRLVPVY